MSTQWRALPISGLPVRPGPKIQAGTALQGPLQTSCMSGRPWTLVTLLTRSLTHSHAYLSHSARLEKESYINDHFFRGFFFFKKIYTPFFIRNNTPKQNKTKKVSVRDRQDDG